MAVGTKLGKWQQRLLWLRRVKDVAVDALQGRQESHGDGDGAPDPAGVGCGGAARRSSGQWWRLEEALVLEGVKGNDRADQSW